LLVSAVHLIRTILTNKLNTAEAAAQALRRTQQKQEIANRNVTKAANKSQNQASSGASGNGKQKGPALVARPAAVITESNSEEDLDFACGNPIQAIEKSPSVVSCLPTHSAFNPLVHEVEALTERYDTNKKMALIRQKVGLALRRGSASANFASKIRTAVFQAKWDLKQFLRDNYELDSQSLARIITITGHLSDAQMCTAGQYLQQTWPSRGVELLQALDEALDAPRDPSKLRLDPSK
jgi:hypothetical protein